MRFGFSGTVDTLGVTVDTDPATDGTQSDKLVIEEGMTDTYTVALNSVPSTEVTVTPTVPTGLSISPTSLTFSTTDYGAKTFTVTAEHDTNLVPETGLNITHAVSGYGEITTADAVTVNVTDDDAAGITVDPKTLAVNEGMTETYMVVLDFEPADDVTVTPSVTANRGLTLDPTSLTFTTSDWETPQEVTVTAADDTNRANEAATITHTADESGSGTAYDLAATAIENISVTVNDNDVITLSVTSLTIAEGSSESYTVVLAQAPNSAVTVTLTLSADSSVTVDTDPDTSGVQLTLSFTSTTWSIPQTVTVVAPQDDDGFSNVGTITHTVSGGGLRASANLSTTVTDDDFVELVVGGNAMYNQGGGFYELSVTEGTDSGANNQFTVKLASQPYPLTENVTFTIDASGASGLTFKKQGETTGSAMLSLTFTGDNWDTAQTVTVGAGHDDDTSDVTYTLNMGLSGANYDNPADTFDFVIEDDDSPGLVISDSVIEIDETDAVVTETYTVKLLTKPSANVTVTLTQPANTDVTVDPTTLTFTSTTWNTAQTVTVSVAADADAGNESARIVHSVSQTGGDMEYGADENRDVSVKVTDDERPGIDGNTATAAMTEPASGTTTQTLNLTLDTPPTSPVTITMAVAAVTPALIPGTDWTNPDISVTQSVVLDDTNYMAGETVTITLSTDRDAEDDVARIDYTVTQSAGAMEYDGFSIASSTVNIADPEQAQILFSQGSESFSAAPGLIMDDGGLLMDLRVRLSHLPRGAVTVRVNFPSGSGLSAETSSSLTFSAGGINATMPLNIEHAGDDDAFDQEYTLDFAVTGYGEGTVEDLTLTVEDKDDVEAILDPMDGMVDVTEGSMSTYKIQLASRPSTSTGTPGTVSVAITSNNSEVTVNPPVVTLNSGNWQDGVMVTVRAAEDADGVDGTATLRHVATSGSGGDYNNVAIAPATVNITDNDELDVIFAPTAVSFTEQIGGLYEVTLATAPTDVVTLTITGPDVDTSGLNVIPATLMFNSGNYMEPQTVNLVGGIDDDTADNDYTITHTVSQSAGDREYEGFAADDVPVTVIDPDRSRVRVVPGNSRLTVEEEGTATYTVHLSHAPASGDTLIVNFELVRLQPSTGSTLITFDADSGTSGDQTALSFTAGDYDTRKTVTVRGVADANLVDETFRIRHSVTGNRASSSRAFMNITRTDNDRANLVLGPTADLGMVPEGGSASYDIKLTQQPSATVTLTVTATGNDDVRFSTDSCSTLTTTGTLEFTTSNWDTAQSLTVCGAEDYDAADDEGAMLTYSAVGGGYGSLNYPATSVIVDDNDTEGVTISPTSVPITEAEGAVATGTYDVTLSAAPTAGSVTVGIAVSNPDVTTSPTSLTFSLSDWTSAGTQTVTKSIEIRVADDDGADNETAQITHTLGGTAYGPGTPLQSVTANITDTDTRGVTITAADPISFNEGGSASYTVVLDTEPTGPVTVSVEDADTTDEIQADKTAVEFTIDNWNNAQTVVVSAASDEDAQDDTGMITHTVTGADYEANNVMAGSVDVTINDLDTRSVFLRIGGVENPTSPAFSIGEGAAEVEYEIRLGTKPVNADNTDGEVTVTVTTSNTSELRIRDLETVSIVDSLTLTFNASNWNADGVDPCAGRTWRHFARHGDDHARGCGSRLRFEQRRCGGHRGDDQ